MASLGTPSKTPSSDNSFQRSNLVLKPTVLRTNEYRLVEMPSEDFLVELVKNCQMVAATRQKRIRDDDVKENSSPEPSPEEMNEDVSAPKLYALKATPEGAAIVTSGGETFGLRRVAYSNSLFLTNVDAVTTLPKSNSTQTPPPPSTTPAPAAATSTVEHPPLSSIILGQELIPALYECARRPAKFDNLHKYLEATQLSLEELEQEEEEYLHHRGASSSPSSTLRRHLKTWSDIFSETVASTQEIRSYLTYRHAMVYRGFVRCITQSVTDSVITAILTQIEARGTARPWEDVPFDLFLSPALIDQRQPAGGGSETTRPRKVGILSSDLGFPIEAVVLGLRVLGADMTAFNLKNASPLAAGSSGHFTLDQEHVTTIAGQVILRLSESKAPGRSNLKKELLLLWQRAVPNGMQPLTDLAKMVNDVTTVKPTTVCRLKPCLSTISPAEGILYCDVDSLSYDPRERIRQLFALTPRIFVTELRALLLPLFYVGGSSSSSDDCPMPKSFPDMDNILGRSCREHRGKSGHFYSME